ncbi:MAG TPA: STAS domain-containing protein [Actinomycetota bacterium]|nr:STAS domain-containing protein [Actinomycetota bacterium]
MSELANLTVASDGDVVVAAMSGEIDLSNATRITREVLGRVPNEALGLVVDLSDVSYLDSAGVRMLSELERRLGWRAQAFGVVAPTGSRCRKVLSIAGMDALLRLVPSVEDARAQMQASNEEPQPPD